MLETIGLIAFVGFILALVIWFGWSIYKGPPKD